MERKIINVPVCRIEDDSFVVHCYDNTGIGKADTMQWNGPLDIDCSLWEKEENKRLHWATGIATYSCLSFNFPVDLLAVFVPSEVQTVSTNKTLSARQPWMKNLET